MSRLTFVVLAFKIASLDSRGYHWGPGLAPSLSDVTHRMGVLIGRLWGPYAPSWPCPTILHGRVFLLLVIISLDSRRLSLRYLCLRAHPSVYPRLGFITLSRILECVTRWSLVYLICVELHLATT